MWRVSSRELPESTGDVMRVGVIGFGSIARRHVANIRKVRPDANIVVCRMHSRQIETPEHADEVVFGLEELAKREPDTAFITGPATTHIETGLAMVRCGADIFMEKPLSDSLEGTAELARLCEEARTVFMMGYTLRFHEPLQILRQQLIEGAVGRVLYARAEVGQYLPDWRPHMDYRQSVSARSDLGGGVLLELSHEFDYVRWMLGDFRSVWARSAQIGDLEIDVEDIAEVFLVGCHGEFVSVHLDMLQRSGGRSCHIHGTDGSLVWKSSTQTVESYSAKEGNWKTIYGAREFDRNSMFICEIEHFFNCVESRSKPTVGYEDGRRALEIVEAARKSSQEGREQPL
jgi:predicted dehydrogenase